MTLSFVQLSVFIVDQFKPNTRKYVIDQSNFTSLTSTTCTSISHLHLCVTHRPNSTATASSSAVTPEIFITKKYMMRFLGVKYYKIYRDEIQRQHVVWFGAIKMMATLSF